MRLFLPCAFLVLLSLPAAADAPRRIASLNLCADQLLLMLVEPERIASLSHWSARPEASWMAPQAWAFPRNRGKAEELLPLEPDLVLASHFTDPSRLRMLSRLGYRVAALDVPADLDAAMQHIREFGALVGAEAAAAALVAGMAERRVALRREAAGLPPKLAVIYAANGVTAGAGTLLHELLELAGLRNLAAELGIRGYGRLSIEQLLVHEPELLVIEGNIDAGGSSLAQRSLRHPALRDRFPAERRVALPAALTNCVGPMNLEAVAMLLAAR